MLTGAEIGTAQHARTLFFGFPVRHVAGQRAAAPVETCTGYPYGPHQTQKVALGPLVTKIHTGKLVNDDWTSCNFN